MTKALDRKKAHCFEILQRAVKEKCLQDCCVGDIPSWKECSSQETCPLWKFRLGGINAYGFHELKKKSQKYKGKSVEVEKLGHLNSEDAA
jgi:hypothetical protein